VNYYAPVFVLYELSTPFLNIHWFCDKVNATGGKVQLINGVILLITFAGSRLVYGSYASFQVNYDMYKAIQLSKVLKDTPPLALSQFAKLATSPLDASAEVIRFGPANAHIPTWLWASYFVSNTILNLLNWFWFGKMIETIRKRFDPPLGTRRKEKVDADISISRSVDKQGRKMIEVDGVEVRKRPAVARNYTTDDIPPPA
jgi:hypothetical protein